MLKPFFSARDDMASVKVALNGDEWAQLRKKIMVHQGL
jgi:hypothetical protein